MSERDEQKYVWIIGSSGMKILQEELEFREIFVPLMDIHDSNPIISRKLHEICARLEFVERLKLTSKFKIDEYESKALQYQLDRLTTYLTLTCVDIAAGKQFISFQKWIIDELEADAPRASVSEMISSVSSSTDTRKLQKTISSWIRKSYDEEYLKKDKEGIGRKFRSFLSEDLPLWLQDWLAEIYVIVYGEEIPYLLSEPEWFKHDSLTRCESIAKHLFELRNKYTHTVEYLPSMEDTKWGTWGVNVDGFVYRFSSFHKDGDPDLPVIRSVGLKDGFSESDIVRLLLVIQMRTWLGINSEPHIITTFFERATYRRLGFEFLEELDINLRIIQAWCMEHLSLYHDAPVVSLHKTSAVEFDKLHRHMHPERIVSLGNLNSYIEEVDVLNSKVTNFINGFDKKVVDNWEISQNKWKLLDSLVETDEIRWIVSNSYQIQRDLFHSLNQSYY